MTDVGKMDPGSDYANSDMNIPEDLPILGNSHYLLVWPIEIEAKTAGGLLLPETAAESIEKLLTVGKVLAKGDMAYITSACLDPRTNEYRHWCEVGDWVVFSRMSQAYAVTHAGRKMWILPDLNILYKISSPTQVDPRYRIKNA